ncbi:MAG: threonine ammonia-lyase, biosynthetic [endosymbiont of Galathealinum brachiosum]|uniref:L-threonine dehydratase n=1 Tax=endosymbiont of Galathealinum brachiosum TaxID=2200906 RepID=A0A370DE66_9GAMM|nr:MAG: threonine ammonia-lyase, biosynthetic [endosymbiont of Galathealinum brachiosum]
MTQKYIEKILTARVYDVAIESPLERARRLSMRLDNQILLKREDLQPVFSFKLRGAYNKLYQLSRTTKLKGVVAASAGNHAQGLALSANKLGVKATIVMPKTTPKIKVDSVRSYGAKAVLVGDTYDDASLYAHELAEKEGLAYIHPYDDPDVIAGQGTVAAEILRQYTDDIDAIFIPVGGGGLIAGMGAFIKYLRPEVKVIAVEPTDAACLAAAMEKKRRVVLNQVGLFADGVAVKQIGRETWRIARQVVDEVITVNTDEICAAIKDIFDDTRSIMEPAGALAVAGIKKYVENNKVRNQTLVAVNSGANMNFDRLRHVSERAELGEHREGLIGVTIPEAPGSFLRFCRLIGKKGITEFNYRYSDSQNAHVFAGIQLADGLPELEVLVTKLRDKSYPVLCMSDNEMAKLHVRHMVGGHANKIENEVLYRFEFPERPGALLEFLAHIGKRWNISLFHYRNHGAAFGRVLVGLQVPFDERKDVKVFLDDLGYNWWDESDNEAYRMFLGPAED